MNGSDGRPRESVPRETGEPKMRDESGLFIIPTEVTAFYNPLRFVLVTLATWTVLAGAVHETDLERQRPKPMSEMY